MKNSIDLFVETLPLPEGFFSSTDLYENGIRPEGQVIPSK